jgi:hypothetical protein
MEIREIRERKDRGVHDCNILKETWKMLDSFFKRIRRRTNSPDIPISCPTLITSSPESLP